MKLRKRLFALLLILTMIFSALPVYAGEISDPEPVPCDELNTEITETDSVGDTDPFTAYLEGLNSAGKAAIRIRLDDQALSGCRLFLNMSGSLTTNTLESLINDGSFIPIEESTEYEGVFIVNKDQIDPDTHYFANGHFWIYRADAVSSDKYIASMWRDDVNFGEDNLATVDFYTVSFKQGEHQVLRLPDSFICKKGDFNNAYHMQVDYRSPSYTLSSYVESPGYLLSTYLDQDGKDIRRGYTLNKPITLTPMFVNEQEARYNHADFSSFINDNCYYDWTYDADTDDNNAVPVEAATPEQLVKALKDNKRTFVIVKGDVTLTEKNVKKICEDNNIKYGQTDPEGPVSIITYPYSENGDFLIVEKGAHLTLDKVRLDCAVNWESRGMYMTVQDGGTLSLINRGGLGYGGLAVQEGGLVDVDNSGYLSCDYLYNHGTIRFAAKNDYNKTKDNKYLLGLQVHDSFFNFPTGVLDAQYGDYDFDLEYNSWIYNDSVNEVGDMALVRTKNDGSMSFTKNCRITIGGGSSVYQHDRCAQMPFVNNGSFTVAAPGGENTLYYNRAMMQIEYGSFINNGSLKISGSNGTLDTKDRHFYPYGSTVRVSSGELVNNGTMDLEVNSGAGMVFSGLYYDPSESKSVSHPCVSEVQKGRLNNNETGTVNVTTNKGSAGLSFDDQTELNNKGTVNLKYGTTGKAASMSVVLYPSYNAGKASGVNNYGSIVNDGYIADKSAGEHPWTGNKWTGSGSEGDILDIGGKGGDKPDPKPDNPTTDPTPVSGGEGATDSQLSVDKDTTSLTMVKGQKLILSDKDWKTSAKSVVSVNKETVTAKKAGDAVLSRGEQSINVRVVAPYIDKNAKTIKLTAGDTGRAELLGTEGLSILYTSSNPDVATVTDDGTVNALSKGSSVITAYVNGIAFKFNVKVADADTSKRDFATEIKLVPLQSVSVKIAGFKPAKASWTSDRTPVDADKLAKDVVFEDDVVRITKAGKITAVGAGTTNLTATGGSDNPVNITVTVSDPVDRTVYINVKSSKTLALYGTKGNLTWEGYDSSTVGVKGNKVTGLAAGETTLTTHYENFTYNITVIVEDPAISDSSFTGKPYTYSITMNAGDEHLIGLVNVKQPVTFISNKNNIAYAGEDMTIHARSKGTAKLTAKVNGKNIVINVKVQ